MEFLTKDPRQKDSKLMAILDRLGESCPIEREKEREDEISIIL